MSVFVTRRTAKIFSKCVAMALTLILCGSYIKKLVDVRFRLIIFVGRTHT